MFASSRCISQRRGSKERTNECAQRREKEAETAHPHRLAMGRGGDPCELCRRRGGDRSNLVVPPPRVVLPSSVELPGARCPSPDPRRRGFLLVVGWGTSSRRHVYTCLHEDAARRRDPTEVEEHGCSRLVTSSTLWNSWLAAQTRWTSPLYRGWGVGGSGLVERVPALAFPDSLPRHAGRARNVTAGEPSIGTEPRSGE